MGIPYFDLLESVDKDDIEAVAVNLERANFTLYEICHFVGKARSAKSRNILLSKVVAEEDKKKLLFIAVERNDLGTIIFLLDGRWIIIDGGDAIQSALIAVRHQSLACLQYFILQRSVDASSNDLHGVCLFADFNKYSLEPRYSAPYLFLIRQGALKNPKNAAAIELVIRKSAQFSGGY